MKLNLKLLKPKAKPQVEVTDQAVVTPLKTEAKSNGQFEEKPKVDLPIGRDVKDPIDAIAPKKIALDFDYIKVGDKYYRTLFVAGYPRFVAPGWLEPIVNFDHGLDVSFFIYPTQGHTVLDELRRKITEMEAEISTDIQRGKIVNPATEAKLEDAKMLQEQLVKGIERFFEFSFYITIPADSLEELENISPRVESALNSVLIVGKRAALDMEKGFISTAPFGRDALSITRNMDTTSLATTFPFTTADLSSDTGVLYGINSQNESFIIFDRFTLENSNLVVFATSGAGKSTEYNEPLLYKNEKGEVHLGKIGALVEKLIKKGKLRKIDHECEGVLEPKITVLTFDKNLKTQWADVQIAARKISPKTLYKMTTASGRSITVTADHNLVVLENGKVTVKRGDSITSGHYIPLPRKTNYTALAKDLICRPKEFVKNWPESLPTTIKFDINCLHLFGLLAAEGHVRPEFVSISNTDPEVLELIKKACEKVGLTTSPIFNYPKRDKVRGFYIRPRITTKLLSSLGCGGRAAKKRVPPIVFTLDNQRVAAFLRAYFEGDGGVEEHEISATSKSKKLVSDLSYLLCRFGIIVRIRSTYKYAANTKQKRKQRYYKLIISGQDNIAAFAKYIGFISKRKNILLKALTKKGNTNVDVIPELSSVFEKIYQELYSSAETPASRTYSEIKLGIFKPSRQKLLAITTQIEQRVSEIENLEKDGLFTLRNLPTIKEVLKAGLQKEKNKLLWKKLGGSWATMRAGTPPQLYNTLQAVEITHGQKLSLQTVGGAVYRSFKVTGESLGDFDQSLWNSIINKRGNCQYQKILKARDYISQKYELKKKSLKKVKKMISWLKTLAQSDLFWDPIVEIKTIKAKHKYVYDLQVDNGVFLAGHGGMFVHNSFFVKLESLRSRMLGTEVIIIDPENEYQALCEAVDGEYISFSTASHSKINPFDLSQIYEEGEDQLSLKILTLHSLFKVVMGELDATQEAMLDRALINAYKAKGITMDPDTQRKEPPLIEDLYKALIGMETKEAVDLAARLEKFVRGSYRGVLDQQTTINLKNPFTVFSVRDIEDTIRPIAMFMILDYIWTRVKRDIKKRLLVVDEAWHMMRYADTAQFLWSIVKRARKYYLGLTTITQDVEDFLSQDIGKAVVTNSAMRLLLKQSPAAINRVSNVFYLSQGERQLLLAADVGEGILFAGAHHAPIRIVASQEEYKLVTTKPQELAEQKLSQKDSQTPSETAKILSVGQNQNG